MKVRMAGLLVLGLFLTTGLAAQEPMTRTEFVELVNAKTEVAEIIAQIRARGIAFAVTPDLEDPLKKLKGGKELLQALAEPATVELTVNVPGAQVVVDGEERDPVPPEGRLVLTGLAPGSHVFRFQAAGYVGDRVDVFLKPGETRPMGIELSESVTAKPGPLGIQVQVQAGTTEDTALVELEFIKNPTERVQRLQSLIERYNDSPMSLLAYGLLQETHLEQNQLDEALAAGNELLARDPQNFNARIRQVRAHLGKGDVEAALGEAARAQQLAQEVETRSAPAEVESAGWERQKQELLGRALSDLGNLSYELFVAANEVPDAARKSALLQGYLELFPDSPYRESGYVNLAILAQQQGDLATMLSWADQGLEMNPDQGVLLVMVADALSDQGQDLPRAEELATRLLGTLEAEPEKLRPAGLGEEQWEPLKQMWTGTAHTALGQIFMRQETGQAPDQMAKTREAIEHFKLASPLLKAEVNSYARNLFRMGFAHAKIGELAEAQSALEEVISLNTPYGPYAEPILEKVKQGLSRRRR